MSKTKTRPDMRAWFRARIDWHTHGMLARNATLPRGVEKVNGDVTSHDIMVIMQDGTTWLWQGGRYSTVKRNGCYAPLMPRPV